MTIFKLLHLADAFTLGNAALGFLAITYISDGKYALAEALILLAVVADGLDGIVARRFGGGRPSLGDYLDIMADYLSFCVAPAILFYQLNYDVGANPFLTRAEDILVGVAAGLFVGFGLLRLARHVAQSGPSAGRFTGLPTTGAGLAATLMVALGGLGDILPSVLLALLAWLMVTELHYPKVRGPLAAAAGALVAAAAAAVVLWPPGVGVRDLVLLGALAAASGYAASGVALAAARVPVGHPGGAEGAGAGAQPERAKPASADARGAGRRGAKARRRPAARADDADSQEVDPDA